MREGRGCAAAAPLEYVRYTFFMFSFGIFDVQLSIVVIVIEDFLNATTK